MTTSPADPAATGHAVAGEPAAQSFDVAVIGAGPAGLSAAVAAADAGANVVLLDGAPRPGGQYWRHRDGDDGAGHHDWPDFERLRTSAANHARAGRLDHRPNNQVWHVERPANGGVVIHAAADGAEATVAARALVIATGAYDRQLPFPGWTLPGVFAAGGVQALLKGHGVVAGRRIVVAGTGPFLLPVAAALADAGVEVAGVFDAGRPKAFLRHPRALLGARAKLAEGAGYLRTLARHRIPYRTRTTVVAAHAGVDGEVRAVTIARLDGDWRVRPGSEREIACDAVAVGYGFTPQAEIAVQAGCAMRIDLDGSLVAQVDARQQSSVGGIFVAGEACGVGGAALAATEGEIAGLAAAKASTGTRTDRAALAALGRRRSAQRRFAAALHDAYPVPAGWQGWLADETLVCRCEEVSAGAIRRAVDDLGATDPRTAKLLTRAGMGLCQGRVCGYATAALVAASLGRETTADDLRAIAGRPIAQPITLGLLAGLTPEPVPSTEHATSQPRTEVPEP